MALSGGSLGLIQNLAVLLQAAAMTKRFAFIKNDRQARSLVLSKRAKLTQVKFGKTLQSCSLTT